MMNPLGPDSEVHCLHTWEISAVFTNPGTVTSSCPDAIRHYRSANHYTRRPPANADHILGTDRHRGW